MTESCEYLSAEAFAKWVADRLNEPESKLLGLLTEWWGAPRHLALCPEFQGENDDDC